MPYYLYCPSLKANLMNRVCKQCGIYYSSIAARKRHRQDGCGLEVLGNKVIDEEEDISHDDDDGDDHAPIIMMTIMYL